MGVAYPAGVRASGCSATVPSGRLWLREVLPTPAIRFATRATVCLLVPTSLAVWL
ncbi:MAG: hypothetical protein NZ821_10090 [Gloeomargarita sp. SKYB31]|nr:hypothetical protein [Gloeomargarita sp. SKYB31]